LTYRVLAGRKVRDQLEDAPPELRGYVDAVVAFLRVDPAAASVAIVLVGGTDYKTIVFGEGEGLSTVTSSRSSGSSSSLT
jgi:hypothetical protein